MTIPSKPATSTPTANDYIVGSVSSNGELIDVVGTNTGTATTLHLVPTGAKDYQRIIVLAVNRDTVEREITILWGGTATKDQIPQKVGPRRGLVKVIDGLKLYRGERVRAFCATTSVFGCYVGVGDRDKAP